MVDNWKVLFAGRWLHRNWCWITTVVTIPKATDINNRWNKMIIYFISLKLMTATTNFKTQNTWNQRTTNSNSSTKLVNWRRTQRMEPCHHLARIRSSHPTAEWPGQKTTEMDDSTDIRQTNINREFVRAGHCHVLASTIKYARVSIVSSRVTCKWIQCNLNRGHQCVVVNLMSDGLQRHRMLDSGRCVFWLTVSLNSQQIGCIDHVRRRLTNLLKPKSKEYIGSKTYNWIKPNLNMHYIPNQLVSMSMPQLSAFYSEFYAEDLYYKTSNHWLMPRTSLLCNCFISYSFRLS